MKLSPVKTKAWKRLADHFKQMEDFDLKNSFQKDPERFDKFSLVFKDILVDFSKNLITEETLHLLLQLADELKLKNEIEAMFSGEKINRTEDRAVLHTALRNRSDEPVLVDGIDIMPEIKGVLLQMKEFSDAVINGSWQGFTGKAVADIVNIGIGGSDLGPVMVTEALKPYQKDHINVHFVSNVDGTHIVETLKQLESRNNSYS